MLKEGMTAPGGGCSLRRDLAQAETGWLLPSALATNYEWVQTGHLSSGG